MEDKQLTVKQEKFALIYARTGDAANSYIEAYGEQSSRHQAQISSYNLLNLPQNQHVQNFIRAEQVALQEKYKYTKESLLRDMVDIKDTFKAMVRIAAQDTLSKADTEKLQRLSRLYSGADVTRTNDQIAKMLGAYEPERIEIKQHWTVSFDDNPLDIEEVEDQAGEIEDATYEDE